MTRHLRLIAAGALVTGLWLPASAFAQNRVEQQMFLDLRTLQEQNQRLTLQINALAEQIKAVSAKVDTEANARIKGFADQQTLINGANSGLSAVQEKISENKVQVQKMTQELEAIKKGVDMLTVMVTQALAQMPASAPAPDVANAGSTPGANAPPAGAAPPAASGVPASSQDYYRAAFSDYSVGQWDMAIQGFQEYLKRFPDAPSAAQAQVLIGSSYFMMGKYQDAVAAYDQVITKYKTSDTTDAVPDAYYNQGVAYEQSSQRDKAVANYQLLRSQYPNSTAALQATQDLKRLGIIKN
jgi:tol-pal system protein YbgF